jgi:hypothetical protein
MTLSSSRRVVPAALLGVLVLPFQSMAWVMTMVPISSRSTRARCSPLQAAQQQQETASSEEIRRNIAAMKQQARERLDALSHQMEELQEQQTPHTMERVVVPHTSEHETNKPGTTSFYEEPEERQTTGDSHRGKELDASKSSSLLALQPNNTNDDNRSSGQLQADSPDLLDDTRWKIGLEIRREHGTWMPEEWGKSGDKLRCQLVVDFSSEKSLSSDGADEEFFHTTTTTTAAAVRQKQLIVREAWILPHGVGADSVGQRPLPVEVRGAYMVAMGQGPCGTHVVRFYLTVEQDVRPTPNSDIYLPAGRMYGTFGYFPQQPHHHSSSAKDLLAEEYNAACRKEAELRLGSEIETRWLFSIEQVQRMKDQWKLKRRIQSLLQQLQQARLKDPDRAQLRLSRLERVGLSREGGVCCKVYKGLSMEYRILGHMEVASDEHPPPPAAQ